MELAAMQGVPLPSVARKAVVVMAGDHGVTAEGVSAYPAAVTAQMVLNFLYDGAAINVLAKLAGARITIVDMGVAEELPDHPRLIKRKQALGTRNFAIQPAMTREQAAAAIQVGMDILAEEAAKGLDLVAIGEMGIGNTTAAAALTAAFTGLPPAQVTWRGTGVDDAGLVNKIAVIERALKLHRPDPTDPVGVLACLGGYEIAGMVGVTLAAAARRIPVVIDGLISSAAALVAVELAPDVRNYLFAAHRSEEIGHQAILNRLGLEPLLDLGMRLGEGSGAAVAFHIMDAATATLSDMATFADAGVSEKAELELA